MTYESIENLKTYIRDAKELEKETPKLPQDKRTSMLRRIKDAEQFVLDVASEKITSDVDEWSEELQRRLQSSIDSAYHYKCYVGD